jgi:hypothetical protein
MIVARASEGAPHPGVGSAGPSFEVVDGRDGSLAHRIPIHDESSILVAPDLDGSGTGDLFRTGIDEESDRPFATALRASDLVMLWNLELEPGAADLGLPHEVGDVTGDGIVDIAFDFSRYLIIGGDPAERVRLVDGATGDLLFDLPFFGAYGAGDIDGDGLGDLILYEKLKDGSTVAFRYRAVTRYGAMLYERTYGITEPPGATVFPQSLTRVGDVNGDGIIDLYQDLAASKGGNVVAASSGVLDGSSGDFLWDAGQLTLVRSAAAPLDSLGIDLIRPSCPGNLFTLRAIAGDSGTTIWETSLDGECTGTLLDTRDMTADGVPDLVMARLSSTGASGLRVVSGADGTSVWSVP